MWEQMPDTLGSSQAGVIAGYDEPLIDDYKIAVNMCPDSGEPTVDKVAMDAAAWAYRNFADTLGRQYQWMFACSAYVSVKYGFISLDDGCSIISYDPDANSAFASGGHSFEFSAEEMETAATVMIATKVNWWASNHHTGMHNADSYLRRCAKEMLGLCEEDDGETSFFRYADIVGQWCSTRIILQMIGVKGIKSCAPIFSTPSIIASTELKRTLSAVPAGCHHHWVASGCILKLLDSPAAQYCTAIAECSSVCRTFSDIMDLPAEYHVNGAYLTGRANRTFADSSADKLFGRLGTFVRYFAGSSIFAKSECFLEAGKVPLGWKYTAYDDYDESFETICMAIRYNAGSTFVRKFPGAGSSVLLYSNSIRAILSQYDWAFFEPESPFITMSPISESTRANSSSISQLIEEADEAVKACAMW